MNNTSVSDPSESLTNQYWEGEADRRRAAALAYDCGFPECLKGGHEPNHDPETWGNHDIIVDSLDGYLDVTISLEEGKFVGRIEFEAIWNDITDDSEFMAEAEYFTKAASLMRSYRSNLKALNKGGIGQVNAARFVRSQKSLEEVRDALGVSQEFARLLWLGVEGFKVSQVLVLSTGDESFTEAFFKAHEQGRTRDVAAA
jgi:hypothetical protein